jgi:redox-sensitive bicupin YhaK (pirin superfamily)
MRKLRQVISAQPAQDGDGVNIHRLAGRRLHQALNPFLMIDEINSDDAADYIGGFPQHAHRGFETITYMKAGRMRHRDHMDNEGIIGPGDVQWMTAGAGVLHSEMPEQDQGLLHGFQIWLNLPAAEKMKPAAYKEIASADITELKLSGGGTVRVIAGKVTVEQRVLHGQLPNMTTQAALMDVQLAANETVKLKFNEKNHALAYVYKGTVITGTTDTTDTTDTIASRQLGIFESGGELHLKAGSSGAELLVLSGQPIREPVVQHGPFVMNTTEEIKRALEDFQNPQYIRQLSSGINVG